jgi:hypothetical protein
MMKAVNHAMTSPCVTVVYLGDDDGLPVFLRVFAFFPERFWVTGTDGSGADVRMIFSLTQSFSGWTYPGGGPVGVGSATSEGGAVSAGGAIPLLVEVQPNRAIQPKTIADVMEKRWLMCS